MSYPFIPGSNTSKSAKSNSPLCSLGMTSASCLPPLSQIRLFSNNPAPVEQFFHRLPQSVSVPFLSLSHGKIQPDCQTAFICGCHLSSVLFCNPFYHIKPYSAAFCGSGFITNKILTCIHVLILKFAKISWYERAVFKKMFHVKHFFEKTFLQQKTAQAFLILWSISPLAVFHYI